MALQTSVSTAMPQALPGLVADNGYNDTITGINAESSAEIPVGVAVIRNLTGGTSRQSAKLPAAATDSIVGVAAHAYYPAEIMGTTGIKPKQIFTICRAGRIWVKVEETVAKGDRPFVRFAAEGGNTQKGSFRKSPGGVANVVTVTPTAVNDTQYGLQVEVQGRVFTFHITADASATATEIADAFRTQMAANSAFAALVTASGTATLILTAANAGYVMTVTDVGNGALAVANTTPAAPTAVEFKGGEYVTAATSGNLAQIQFDTLTNRSHQ